MSEASTVRTYWDSAERRDWERFGSLLSEEVVYRLPQTGERIDGRDRYLMFNIDFPGDWHLRVERVVAQDRQATSWVAFRVDGQQQTAITFFTFDAAGLITEIVDFWPEPYDAPPRAGPTLQ